MDYKVNLLMGETQSRPGYVELNAIHIRDLNGSLEDGECTEIIALDTIDFFPHDKRGDFLNHLMQKLEIGSIMKIGGREINAIANAIVLGQINEETANAALYGGGRQSVTSCIKTRDLIRFLGLDVVQTYYHGFNYVVEARRVA